MAAKVEIKSNWEFDVFYPAAPQNFFLSNYTILIFFKGSFFHHKDSGIIYIFYD